ncbi:hypothetical protein [Lacinutrix salivirga]
MDTKKDIGKAIKNSLSQLNETPSENVWENIELELKKEEKDDYIIPFWFKYGSIAVALLLILFLIFNTNSSIKNNIKKQPSQNIIVDQKLENKAKSKISNHNTQLNNTIINTSVSTKKITHTNSNKNTTSNSIKRNNFLFNSVSKNSKNASINNKPNTIVASENVNSSNTLNNNVQLEKTNKSNSLINSKTQITEELKVENDTVVTHKNIVLNQDEKTQEKETKKQQSKSKWQVMPFVSADYYGSYNTARKKNTTFNYGVYLTYKANEDLSIRLGAKPVVFEFTEKQESTTINKVIKYTEIPLEIKYRLYDNYIDTSVVFGLSYLLLEKDETYSNNVPITTYDQPFSTTNISLNAGFNFEKSITKRFSINVEPTFKLHLNTFKKPSNNGAFNVSVLTGIQYSF